MPCDKVGGFPQVLRFFHQQTNKTNHHDISKILLKVALDAINLSQTKWANVLLLVDFGPLQLKICWSFTNLLSPK